MPLVKRLMNMIIDDKRSVDEESECGRQGTQLNVLGSLLSFATGKNFSSLRYAAVTLVNY